MAEDLSGMTISLQHEYEQCKMGLTSPSVEENQKESQYRQGLEDHGE